jgi:hypothetical protein
VVASELCQLWSHLFSGDTGGLNNTARTLRMQSDSLILSDDRHY